MTVLHFIQYYHYLYHETIVIVGSNIIAHGSHCDSTYSAHHTLLIPSGEIDLSVYFSIGDREEQNRNRIQTSRKKYVQITKIVS